VYTSEVPDDTPELDFYRSVEDLFATLRGVPHVLSPKDFQLMRSWWNEGVPMAAVAGGITEVFARRRERGDDDPVVSLSYCRHAVKKHAKRLAEMHVGESPEAPQTEPVAVEHRLRALASELESASDDAADDFPAAAAAVRQIAGQLGRFEQMPLATLEDSLFSLEAVMLDSVWRSLTGEQRRDFEEVMDQAVAASGADGDAAERTRRAIRDRELRRRLRLPRLEIA
jgi:hypothetical protein